MSELSQVKTLKQWRIEVYAETQKEFAARIGFDVTTLSSWETDRKVPRLRTQRLVAERLGILRSQVIWPEGKLEAAA